MIARALTVTTTNYLGWAEYTPHVPYIEHVRGGEQPADKVARAPEDVWFASQGTLLTNGYPFVLENRASIAALDATPCGEGCAVRTGRHQRAVSRDHCSQRARSLKYLAHATVGNIFPPEAELRFAPFAVWFINISVLGLCSGIGFPYT